MKVRSPNLTDHMLPRKDAEPKQVVMIDIKVHRIPHLV